MVRSVLALALLCMAPAALAAPDVSVDAGVSYTRLALRGSAGGGDGAHTTTLREGLGYDKAGQRSGYVAFEHAASAWPNLRLSHLAYDVSAQRIQPLPGPPGRAMQTRSRLRLSGTDLAFYYTPLTGPVKLDLGLDLHRLAVDFAIDVRANGRPIQAVHARQTQWFPAVYAGAHAALPLTGWQLGGNLVASTYQGRNLVQAQAALGWSPLPRLDVQLGYEYQLLKFSSDNIAINMHAHGPYAALALRW